MIVAEQSIPTRDPNTGQTSQKAFVLQAPIGINSASAAIPAMTTLVLQQGVILKMQNAALLVQNQGSVLQVLAARIPTRTVTVTSYKDSSVGGVSNGNPNSTPAPGDYGGIVFVNFDQAGVPGGAARSSLFPGQIPITGVPTSDDRLKDKVRHSERSD